MRRQDRGVLFLTAKPAAGGHLDDANLFRGHGKHWGERLLDEVRTLHRTPNGDAAVFGEGNHAVRFNVELLLRLGFVFAFHHDPGRPIDVALLQQVGLDDVVRAPNHLFAGQRIGHRKDGG